MKKYITPALTVENFNVKEQMLFCSEIDKEITDGGAAKGTYHGWEDDSLDEE